MGFVLLSFLLFWVYLHMYIHMDIGGAAKGNAFGIMTSVFIYILLLAIMAIYPLRRLTTYIG